MILHILFIAIGGAAGSILRFLVQKHVNAGTFPAGTLIINLAGCFIIGILSAILYKRSNEGAWLFWATGFCGGFTTFSAFSLESLQMLQQSRWILLISYTGLSVAGGLLATWAGYKIFSE